VESVKGLAIIIFLFSSFSFAEDLNSYDKKMMKVAYYTQIFGHIHRNPSRYSNSLSTIGCGHPLKLYELRPKGKPEPVITLVDGKWYFVSAGPYEGYVLSEFISDSKPDCFQDRYPKFFDELGLELADMYYWGKLSDQLLNGRSRAK
jgi:hypothetical protein